MNFKTLPRVEKKIPNFSQMKNSGYNKEADYRKNARFEVFFSRCAKPVRSQSSVKC